LAHAALLDRIDLGVEMLRCAVAMRATTTMRSQCSHELSHTRYASAHGRRRIHMTTSQTIARPVSQS
jgi:hypothetical protein